MLECFIQIKGPLVSSLALVNPQLPALTLVGVGDSEGGLQHPETFREVCKNKVHEVLFSIHTVLLSLV